MIDVSHPDLLSLYALWNEKRGGKVLAERKDFDPFVLKPWLGHVTLLDAVENGSDFVFRLYGSELVNMFGFDLTGRRVGECLDLIGEKPLREYRWSHAYCKPLGISRSSPANEDLVDMDKIVLPLSNGGADPDVLLAAIYKSSYDD